MFTTQRRVEFADTDAAGIAHFSSFMLYMEQAEHEFLRSRGLSVMMHDDQGALSWPRVSVSCQYSGAVRFEDLLDVELRIVRLGEKSITYGFRFEHAGRAVATGEVTAVCCRLSAEGPLRSVAISPELRARLSS